jgi:hypothetical protein
MIPELWAEPGTVLYIGAFVQRFDLGPQLYAVGHEIIVVEIWQPFIDDIKAHRISKLMAHIVRGDVREIDKAVLPHKQFDWTIWNHGPEHVYMHELKPTIKKLEALTKKAVVMGCPWGWYPQDEAYDNPHSIHKSRLYPGDFMSMKYGIACIGPKDRQGGHILAWKYIAQT